MAGPALVEFTDALGASAPLFVQCATWTHGVLIVSSNASFRANLSARFFRAATSQMRVARKAWGANTFGSAESETTEAEKEICRLVIFDAGRKGMEQFRVGSGFLAISRAAAITSKDGSHCWRGPLCRRHLAGPLGESRTAQPKWFYFRLCLQKNSRLSMCFLG